MTTLAPGMRCLIRGQPLLPPIIIDHVRTWFAGEPEPNGPVFWRHDAPGWAQVIQSSDQCEMLPVPVGYEPPPQAGDRQQTLDWLIRNCQQLIDLHGAESYARAERHVREQIRLHDSIADALADEPAVEVARLWRESIDRIFGAPITEAEVAAASDGDKP